MRYRETRYVPLNTKPTTLMRTLFGSLKKASKALDVPTKQFYNYSVNRVLPLAVWTRLKAVRGEARVKAVAQGGRPRRARRGFLLNASYATAISASTTTARTTRPAQGGADVTARIQQLVEENRRLKSTLTQITQALG